MSSRRIPISVGAPPTPAGGTNRAPSNAQNNPAWQSSLDIVFSFSRSQAFFGSNLPTSPSFVQRYRRPNLPDDEESITTGEGRTTSDDGNESWSEDEIDARAISWDGEGIPPPPRLSTEQLPRNAVGAGGGERRNKSTSSSRARRAASVGSTAGSATSAMLAPPPPQLSTSAQQRAGVLNERSPLLSRKVSQEEYRTSFSPPDSVPFPRRSPQVSAALLDQHNKKMGGDIGDRRMSIISAEGWKEAVNEHRGMSTFGQTLFNAVNVLVGVGLLAEALAFADAGWVMGTILLLFCALITNYTAKMLARLMSRDQSLRTYTDVLIKAFGTRARPIVHAMFVFELGALSIALVVLFSDTMSNIFPEYSSTFFKIVGFFLILPTTFIPLRFLSITSIVGILSSFFLLFILVADGTIKRHAPGSLWVPAHTSIGPRWVRFPLSFGLFMSGFAGHAVIPALYRDMKEPHRFEAMINTAYVIAFTMSMLMGALGYVMFGNGVSDEVIGDIRRTEGYPRVLNEIALWMIAINPVVKYALASGPLASTLEYLVGLREPDVPSSPIPANPLELNGSAILSEESTSSIPSISIPSSPRASFPRRALLFLQPFIMRTVLLALIVVLSILIPNFGIVLSFLGSTSAFAICAIGPIGAYLLLGRRTEANFKKRDLASPTILVSRMDVGASEAWKGTGPKERVLCWALLSVSVVFAAVGSVWVFLPMAREEKHRML